ncbi:MAG: type II toxin-antitoxin system Phd/YefM family antitoxin [Nitrospirae bacterium]|nr:type II toxin-antitoxin system Phd/YefM family antitoxin [Nitrospirota bacterium]
MAAGRFKSECLGVLDRVSRTGEPMVVTKRGRPVAKIVSVEPPSKGTLRGSVRYLGDIVEPLGEKWGTED